MGWYLCGIQKFPTQSKAKGGDEHKNKFNLIYIQVDDGGENKFHSLSKGMAD